MGIFGEIGKELKKGFVGISDDFQKKQGIQNTKKRILDRFEMSELKSICSAYGIGSPYPFEEEPLTGKRYKVTITREHFINRIVYHLTLDQIRAFCDKNRIKIGDLVKQEPMPSSQRREVMERTPEVEPQITPREVKKQDQFDMILEDIENNFKIIEDVIDEKDFKKQLTQFLMRSSYGDKIRIEAPNAQGRADILINNKYLLELKIAKNRGQLRDLKGQVHDYSKSFSDIAVILVSVGEMTIADMKEYIDDFASFGAKRTLIIEGKLSRTKKKRGQIIINR